MILSKALPACKLTGTICMTISCLRHAMPAIWRHTYTCSRMVIKKPTIEIVETVRLAIPFFDDFVLEPEALNSNSIMLQVAAHSDSTIICLFRDQLSDGSLRFICLGHGALMQPDPPSTIIIDEPELGLHPYAHTLLGSSAWILHLSDMQVIVATQSPQLLDEFSS